MAGIDRIGQLMGNVGSAAQQTGKSNAANPTQFLEELKRGIAKVDGEVKAGDASVQQYVTGQGGQTIPEVIVALERADVSLRYMVQVRNKVLEAYNEVMRMPV